MSREPWKRSIVTLSASSSSEIADGWLGLFLSPEHAAEQLGEIAKGRANAGATMAGFDVVASAPVVVGDDVAACADKVRSYAALYVGGMGSREQNFYNALAVRMGYGDAAARVQDMYLGGDPVGAAAELPIEFLDQTSLLGPVDRIADRLVAYAESGVTTLSVIDVEGADVRRTLRQLADACEKAGLAG